MSAAKESTIVVVGAGIIGLASALKIQELVAESPSIQSTKVLVVAKEWPTSIAGSPPVHSVDYASMWAGAHIRPIPSSTAQLRREAKWLKHTVAEFERHHQSEPWAGLRRLMGVEYLEDPSVDYLKQNAQTFADETGLSGYRKYEASELPEGVKLGFEYETYCVNSPMYCGNLLRKFIVQGGRTLERDLKSEWEAFSLASDVKFVVNASGMGFKDPKTFPIRGQTALTNFTTADKTITRQNKDGSWSFVIPRSFNGGTIIGGTKEPNNWNLEPSSQVRQRLLSAAQPIIPQASSDEKAPKDLEVIRDIVGRRPARDGGMRVETETEGEAQEKRHVIHAYGAGGRGYELSWGVANKVVELARVLVYSTETIKSKL